MQSQIDEITAALSAGDGAAAEKLARERLAVSPDDGFALSALGQALLARGQADEAEKILCHPRALAARHETYELLADAQYLLSAFDRCEATLDARLVLDPPMSAARYGILAKLKASRGAVHEADDLLRKALARSPDDLELIVLYLDFAFAVDPPRVFADIDRCLERLSSRPGVAPVLLRRRTIYRATLRERELGVSAYPSSWSEIWTWLDPEGFAQFESAVRDEVRKGKTNLASFLDFASFALMRQQWEEAGSLFKFTRKNRPGSYADAAAFGATFHAELDAMSDEELVRDLAPVHRLAQADFTGPAVLYLASDRTYFLKFSLPFLRALNEKAPGQDVQVHIMDGNESEWRDLMQLTLGLDDIRIGFSAEASAMGERPSEEARFYYHAVRFIRFYEEIKRLARPIWLVDVDAHLIGDPREGLAGLAQFDVALVARWNALDPVLKLAACCVGVSPTTRGIAFVRRVAAYVRYWKDRGANLWGTDQLALLSCYAHQVEQGIEPRTLFLQPSFVGAKGETTGALRFMGGITKYRNA